VRKARCLSSPTLSNYSEHLPVLIAAPIVQICESFYLFRLCSRIYTFVSAILKIFYVLQLSSFQGHFDYVYCMLYHSIIEAADFALP
jgi:hypothetical protein